MARRSSGGRSGPRPAARAPLRNPPKPAAPAPPPTPVQSGPMMGGGGLGSIVAEGMAFGGGNAIAHRAVDAMMGPRVVKHETVASLAPSAEAATMNSHGGPDACVGQLKAFQDCLNNSASEISKCQFYMDMLSECNRNAGPGLSAY